MRNTSLVELLEAAQKIERRLRESDQKVLEAAALVVQCKKRFDRFEVRATWRQWSQTALSFGQARLYELLRIGQAADPQTELELQRDERRQRQARYSAARITVPNAPADLEPSLKPPQKRLIAWIKTASPQQVQFVLSILDKSQHRSAVSHAAPVAPQGAQPFSQSNQTPAVERRKDLPPETEPAS